MIRLTAGHGELLAAVRDEWLGHGLCTEPAERSAAEAGVRATYRATGLAPPRTVVWVDSPLEGVNYFYRLCAHRGKDDRIRVKGHLQDYTHVQFSNIDKSVRDTVVAEVGKPVEALTSALIVHIERTLQVEADEVVNRRFSSGVNGHIASVACSRRTR